MKEFVKTMLAVICGLLVLQILRFLLFFVIFGVSGEDLEVSQKRHHVDELPEGLDIRTFTRAANGDWIDGWFSGAYETVLKAADALWKSRLDFYITFFQKLSDQLHRSKRVIDGDSSAVTDSA